MKRIALVASALLVAACGAGGPTTSSSATSAPPSAPKTVVNSAGSVAAVIDNNGTFVVGIDIPSGKYRAAGGPACYWARLRSLNPSDIIESKKASDPQIVTISPSDTAFMTQNCGTWQLTF
jgi:hypothetical protein